MDGSRAAPGMGAGPLQITKQRVGRSLLIYRGSGDQPDLGYKVVVFSR